MKKVLLLLVLIAVSCSTNRKLHTETYKGHEILVGEGSRSDLEKPPYSDWFTTNYNEYSPDKQVLEQLKPSINDYDITVVLGTWCGDSREQTPVLFKILDQAGYNKKVKLVFVPRKYKNYKPAQSYNLIRVPNIILYKDGKQQGRIIEYPIASMEKDLLQILKGNYMHELEE